MHSLTRTFAVILGLVLFIGSSDASAQGRRRTVRSGPPENQPTSFQLIDQAASDGTISADQALVYKVFATYDDPRLPQNLTGDDSAISDTTFMTDVLAKYPTLPVDVQLQVAPFLIPPFHQNSWWELRQQQQVNGPYASLDVTTYGIGYERPCTDCPLSFEWEFVPTFNGKVKVWYYASDLASKTKAQEFAAEIDAVIWPELKGLMGREPMQDDGDGLLGAALGGDERLDIALIDIDRSITQARFPDKCKSAAWSYIQFNRDRSKEELAHELMHSFQYAFNVKVRGGDCTGEAEYRWLMESTAEWVKDYIYPNTTTHNEHWAAPHYLQIPEAPLNHAADPHWYGAYLFPFFLDRIKGQHKIVGQIWANTEGAASLPAIEQSLQPLGGFEKMWPEFVLHNWNNDPVDDYQKLDKLTAKAKALGEPLLTNGAIDKYAALNYELHHLSASYKHFVFNDNVNSFAFINGMTFKISTERRFLLNTWDLGEQFKWEPLTADQKKGASVQAILKRNGKWEEPLDWTNIPYKAFCRQKPDEKIEEIVLIFANGNHDESSVLKPTGLPPQLIVTDMGCRFEGTTDWDSGPALIAGAGNVDLQYHNTWEPRDFMEPVELFLGYYYNVNGHANWSVTGSVGPCSTGKTVPHAPIRTDLLTFSMNFAPKNSSGYRRGYYQLHLTTPLNYSLHCPPGDIPLSHTFIFFPAVSFDPLMYIDTAPGGGLKGTTNNPLGVWKWDYKPKK